MRFVALRTRDLGYFFKLIKLICEGKAIDLQKQTIQFNHYAAKEIPEIPSAAWAGSCTIHIHVSLRTKPISQNLAHKSRVSEFKFPHSSFIIHYSSFIGILQHLLHHHHHHHRCFGHPRLVVADLLLLLLLVIMVVVLQVCHAQEDYVPACDKLPVRKGDLWF